MKIETSPECNSGRHQFCDVKWRPVLLAGVDGPLNLCDCGQGDCHQNHDELIANGHFPGQQTLEEALGGAE